MLRMRRITQFGRKKSDRVVAPIIGQTFVDEVFVCDEGMDRQ